MLKFLNRHWQSRQERFYSKSRWHLVLDLSLGVIIIILAVIVVTLIVYRPNLSWLKYLGQTPAVNINNPPLAWEAVLATTTVKLTESATLKITLKNQGAYPAGDIRINLNAIDRNFSFSRIEAATPDAGAQISDQTIIWPTLSAGASRSADFRVSFAAKDEASRLINWQAQLAYVLAGQTLTETLTLPVLKLAGELTAASVAYYNSPQGDQLGVGPVPPVVGLPTDYWLFWEAKSRGEFKNLVMSGKLPRGVEPTGNRSLLSGELTYNTSTRLLIWRVPSLSADNSYDVRAGLEIRLIPTASQLGQVPVLLSNIRYYATDALTGDETAGNLADLDTNLEADKINQGQGTVSAP